MKSPLRAWPCCIDLGRVVGAIAFTLTCTPGFALDVQLIEDGFDHPLFLTAPAGDSRLFVVQQGGVIKVRSGTTWSTFLDLSGQVNAENERGLLGLAFDPNFRTNGRFYVDYIDNTRAHNTQIARFTLSPTGALTQTPVLTIAQPPSLSNHKAGWIGFRPGDNDNLYIATGDGGGQNDKRPDPAVDNNAQNTNRLLGKILRINPNGDDFPNDPNRNYTIPAGNPFVQGKGAPEVWDYGLRNPYRDSFDRKTGNFIIADVGQETREEIDFEAASNAGGNNYGWRLREGKGPNPEPGVGGLAPGAIDPVYDYPHGIGSDRFRAITGGYVYRGDLLKDLDGTYFFADFVTGQVWSMKTDPQTGELLPDTVVDISSELKRHTSFGSISSFGEDGFGNLYIVDYNGKVFELVPEPQTYVMMLLMLASMAWRLARSRRAAMQVA